MPQITITQTPLRFGTPEPQKAPISPKRAALMKRYARACQLELRSRQAKTVGGKGRDYDWSRVGRPNQLAPPGNWSVWLLMAGRGFGKSRSGAEWVRAAHERVGRIALVAPTAADARDVMVEGESGLLAISPPWDRPIYEPSKRRVTWPNGSIATLYSADEPERLRGPQHGAAWCLVGDTLVSTPMGQKQIKDLVAGDIVLTRDGSCLVLRSHMTRIAAQIYRLTTLDKRVLYGTADHPVYSSGRWTPLGELRPGDSLCVEIASSGMVAAGTLGTAGTMDGELGATVFACASTFIARSTQNIMELYRKVTTSIIKMRIPVIGQLITWKRCLMGCIAACMELANLVCERTAPQFRLVFAPGQIKTHDASGVVWYSSRRRPLQENFVRPIVKNDTDRSNLKWNAAHAIIVGLLTTLPGLIKDFAQLSAKKSIRGLLRNRVTWFARCVEQFLSVHVATQSFAQDRVPCLGQDTVKGVEKLATRAPVYNIQVEGAHEFFANDILVHNCDELGSWRYPEAWDMLMFGLRLGQHPQVVVTTTPRPIKIVKDLLARAGDDVVVTRASTYENRDNLPEAFFAQIVAKYEGTRLGRQELDAELLEDVPGALWSRALIEAARVRALTRDLERVVVAVDPAVSSEEGSDETGIVVVGRDREGHGYVLADASGRYTPREWAEVVIGLYRTHAADRVVAEVNQGGAMVEATLRMVDPNVPFTAVRATRGKVVRAEPVAALYEQTRVHHLGFYPQLEDQMVEFTSDFDKARAGYSPDRVDAMVWGFSDLLVEAMPFEGLMRWYQQQAEARG